MAAYLVYWKPETVADSQLPSLQYSASNQYGKLAIGDILWIVTSEGPNDLVLVGRQFVDQIVEYDEAVNRLGTTELWNAKFYALSDAPEAKENLTISSWASQLRFRGSANALPEGFTGRHFQTIRCLDEKSAELLERLWKSRLTE